MSAPHELVAPVFDPELRPDIAPSDLYSLRERDLELDARASRIQKAAVDEAVRVLTREKDALLRKMSNGGVLVTGSAGYLGRPLVKTLASLGVPVRGLDVVDVSRYGDDDGTTVHHEIGSVADVDVVKRAVDGRGIKAVIHAGALHAPHATHHSEEEFAAVNVRGTKNVLSLGLPTVFTSTTSHTITNDIKAREARAECCWFDGTENACLEPEPIPRNKYGRTKRRAEKECRDAAAKGQAVVVLRPPRFFCEDVLDSSGGDGAVPIAHTMMTELLGRRAALVDVVVSHVKALVRVHELRGRTLTLAAPWPFLREETSSDGYEVAKMIKERWGKRCAWRLPEVITRVYDSKEAREALSWDPLWDFERAVMLLQRGDEVVLEGLF